MPWLIVLSIALLLVGFTQIRSYKQKVVSRNPLMGFSISFLLRGRDKEISHDFKYAFGSFFTERGAHLVTPYTHSILQLVRNEVKGFPYTEEYADVFVYGLFFSEPVMSASKVDSIAHHLNASIFANNGKLLWKGNLQAWTYGENFEEKQVAQRLAPHLANGFKIKRGKWFFGKTGFSLLFP